MQRMYFQCDPTEDVADWSDDRIWVELQARVGANGYSLKEGPITSKTVLPFRSYVCEPMRHGNLLLAGDAAHTVPPTGAKGLNLALADVKVLAEVLERSLRRGGDPDGLDEYTGRALARVWKAQHFSYWMTTMLHRVPDATDFDVRRQIGELSSVVGSRAGSTFLAEAYTGWPTG
jgi:p-hydroxybenzoate 3-monooxygenase